MKLLRTSISWQVIWKEKRDRFANLSKPVTTRDGSNVVKTGRGEVR
jgi:hypothetical protein